MTGRQLAIEGPPVRLQLQRKKGWRLPDGARSVARPTKWGNPFFVDRWGDAQSWLGWYVGTGTLGPSLHCWGEHETKEAAVLQAVELYRLHTGPMGNYELDLDEVRRELGGRDLACWCPVGTPCHGDVLLEIANEGSR